MPSNKVILASIATLLFVIVVFMVVDISQRPQSVGESLEGTVQALKDEVSGP